MTWKKEMNKGITDLQKEACKNEKEIKRELGKSILNKERRKLDTQYWNGYLDALSNTRKLVISIKIK